MTLQASKFLQSTCLSTLLPTMATIKPPFTFETATQKLKTAQNLWNTRDPARVAKAYTAESIWRNRHWFVKGTKEIEALLTMKWEREKDYKLRKELFAFENRKIGTGADERWEGRIAVQFWYEYRDKEDGMKWKRCYGLEDWTYDERVRVEQSHDHTRLLLPLSTIPI